MTDHARITIEVEEEGFVLRIDAGADQRLLLVENPEELYRTVRHAMEPWLHEQKEARREAVALRRAGQVFHNAPDDIEEDAYELTDPKHPRHHEVFADLATKEER